MAPLQPARTAPRAARHRAGAAIIVTGIGDITRFSNPARQSSRAGNSASHDPVPHRNDQSGTTIACSDGATQIGASHLLHRRLDGQTDPRLGT